MPHIPIKSKDNLSLSGALQLTSCKWGNTTKIQKYRLIQWLLSTPSTFYVSWKGLSTTPIIGLAIKNKMFVVLSNQLIFLTTTQPCWHYLSILKMLLIQPYHSINEFHIGSYDNHYLFIQLMRSKGTFPCMHYWGGGVSNHLLKMFQRLIVLANIASSQTEENTHIHTCNAFWSFMISCSLEWTQGLSPLRLAKPSYYSHYLVIFFMLSIIVNDLICIAHLHRAS